MNWINVKNELPSKKDGVHIPVMLCMVTKSKHTGMAERKYAFGTYYYCKLNGHGFSCSMTTTECDDINGTSKLYWQLRPQPPKDK